MARKVLGACEACGGDIKAGSRFIEVRQRGRGAHPEPDLFHARCPGAFRDGWGA